MAEDAGEVVLKILYLSSGNIPSRRANAIQQLFMAKGFFDAGHEVEWVIPGVWGKTKEETQENVENFYGVGIEFKCTALKSHLSDKEIHVRRISIRFLIAAICYVKSQKPDMVYVRNRFLAQACLLMGLPVLYEYHGAKPFFSSLKMHCIKRKNFIGMVTISSGLKAQYQEMGISGEKIIVEADAVDLSLHAQQPHQVSVNASPVVVYAGHLYDFKGIPLLLALAERMSGVTFRIIGGWPDGVRRLKRLCESKRLHNVDVMGFLKPSDIPFQLQKANALILPTSKNHAWASTTSPLKLFEYMAAKKPILASRLPNIASVLNHEKNALLAEPDNVNDFQGALEKILGNPQLSERLANRAYKDVQPYTYVQRATRIMNLVNQPVKECRGTACLFH